MAVVVAAAAIASFLERKHVAVERVRQPAVVPAPAPVQVAGEAERAQPGLALPANMPAGDDVEIDHEQGGASFDHEKEWSYVDFSDVAGMARVKQRLYEAGAEVFAPRASGQRARNGVLLFGEPGNGKTFFADALAGELGVGIVRVSFGDVVSRWVGQTTEQVVRVFRDAVAQAPCVLFIDEIDSLVRNRYHQASASEESARTTNALLTEIVALRKHPVLLVAATNHLDELDAAAIREGRFDFKVEITPPDAEARRGLIGHALARHEGVEIGDTALEQAVRRWEGFSVTRIGAIVETAARNALRMGQPEIDYLALQSALRETQGRAGSLPPGTPSLDMLALPESLHRQLSGVALRMQHVEETERLGGKVPSGLLFQGPPGSGKTLVARALARSTQWAFLETTGSELLAKPERIDCLLREARDLRPCIVFLDEADDVLLNRSLNSSYGVSVTNRLLTAMDGASGRTPDVLWIAATNAPEKIDPAALRGGRFSVKLAFGAPDAPTLMRTIEDWLRTSPAVFDEHCTLETLAGMLEGLTVANVLAVLQQAANLAADRALAGGDERVGPDDVAFACEEVVDFV